MPRVGQWHPMTMNAAQIWARRRVGAFAEIVGQDRVACVVALASNAVAGLYPLDIFADFEHHACVAVAGGARKCYCAQWFAAVCVAVDFRANAYGGVVVLHQNAVVGHGAAVRIRPIRSAGCLCILIAVISRSSPLQILPLVPEAASPLFGGTSAVTTEDNSPRTGRLLTNPHLP